MIVNQKSNAWYFKDDLKSFWRCWTLLPKTFLCNRQRKSPYRRLGWPFPALWQPWWCVWYLLFVLFCVLQLSVSIVAQQTMVCCFGVQYFRVRLFIRETEEQLLGTCRVPALLPIRHRSIAGQWFSQEIPERLNKLVILHLILRGLELRVRLIEHHWCPYSNPSLEW